MTRAQPEIHSKAKNKQTKTDEGGKRNCNDALVVKRNPMSFMNGWENSLRIKHFSYFFQAEENANRLDSSTRF